MGLDNFCFNNKSRFVEFFIGKKYRVYRHLLILTYLLLVMYDPNGVKEYSGPYSFYNKTIWFGYFLLMVYINMYVLIPRFLLKSRFVTYLISLIAMVVCSYALIRIVRTTYIEPYRILPDKIHHLGIYREILNVSNILIMLVFSSTAIKLFQEWVYNTNRINELERNSLEIELKELKNQVNPHFLFNMLNNVSVLVKKDTDKASQIIMKLSGFLRHLLYQNRRDAVALVSEIQFLNDFLELENIRRDDFSFTIDVVCENEVKGVMLPPNLFVTFVENAVKHSVDLDNPSRIDIGFGIVNHKLVFSCVNTKPEEPIAVNNDGGLGLINIRRQLELLYGGAFDLDIKETDSQFMVKLTLLV